MGTQFIDQATPPLSGCPGRRPAELAHGLLVPPPRVLEIVEAEKAKAPPGFFLREALEGVTNELTLQYYFDGLGHDVLYCSTPAGPEVPAVGSDEILSLKESLPRDEQRKLKTWIL